MLESAFGLYNYKKKMKYSVNISFKILLKVIVKESIGQIILTLILNFGEH